MNNSEGDSIKLKMIKEPINSINKEITHSKNLIENFFKKLNESIDDNTGKVNYVKKIFKFSKVLQI